MSDPALKHSEVCLSISADEIQQAEEALLRTSKDEHLLRSQIYAQRAIVHALHALVHEIARIGDTLWQEGVGDE